MYSPQCRKNDAIFIQDDTLNDNYPKQPFILNPFQMFLSVLISFLPVNSLKMNVSVVSFLAYMVHGFINFVLESKFIHSISTTYEKAMRNN